MNTGIELIAEERQRQVDREGYTLKHDDTHDQGEMAISAGCYALHGLVDEANLEKLWPFGSCEWNPKSKLRNLIRAGALIAAEIDRLQRAGATP